MNRVRVNSVYTFRPVLIDRADSALMARISAGDRVRVINLYGCPRANTMGHCHVADATTGRFIALVCCNSLVKS